MTQQAGGEFDLIGRYFTRPAAGSPWPSQGVGDDCAIIDIGGRRIAVTVDMMAIGSHFLEGADPYKVGRKAVAVNLSDLAACGAQPRAFFLSIGLPGRDDPWLAAFSRGLFDEAGAWDCALLGGDTTHTPRVAGGYAPVVISITAMGDLPAGGGLTRAGARPGDDVWVSGTPGDAYTALKIRWGHWQQGASSLEYLAGRMDTPQPRVALGLALRGLASAAADISDGLAGDLGHILERSQVSARLAWTRMPVSPDLACRPLAQQAEAVLGGGDDYELIFTAPAQCRDAVLEAGRRSATRVTRIGTIAAGTGLVVEDGEGRAMAIPASFDHFAAPSP